MWDLKSDTVFMGDSVLPIRGKNELLVPEGERGGDSGVLILRKGGEDPGSRVYRK